MNNQKTESETQSPDSLLSATTVNAYEVVHFVVIKVYDKRGGTLIELLKWTGLKWELRIKYDWYYRYRAALLQVKYPKFEVNTIWGNEPATGKTLQEIRQSKIRARKAKITEYKNKLEKFKKSWVSIFPFEDDQYYQRAVHKISRLEAELLSF